MSQNNVLTGFDFKIADGKIIFVKSNKVPQEQGDSSRGNFVLFEKKKKMRAQN